VANTLVIPFAPTSVDLWTVDPVMALLKEARAFNQGLRAYAVLNKAFARGSDNRAAAELWRDYPAHGDYLDTPIGTRNAFSTAFGGGYAVTEYQPKDAKAITEMTALYQHAFYTTSVS
jgi:chromosome partitioning protein